MPEATSNHARVLSLILALAVVVGGWLALEYANQAHEPLERAPGAVEGAASAGEPNPPSLTQEPLEEPARPSRDGSAMYKCQKNGHVSFGDKPCPVGAKELSATAAPQSQPVDSERLSRMKTLAAQMESDRLARERALQSEGAVQQVADSQSGKSAQCKYIDERIVRIDALLRQPHDGQTGDYLTGERKKLTDQRFDIGC